MTTQVEDQLVDNYYMLAKKFKLSNDSVNYGNFQTIKNLEFYKLKDANKNYLINSFHEIGWPDPFPHE